MTGGTHLLFVCTGNICRSPMGERLMTAFAAEAGLSGLTAASAGTRAVVVRAMEPSAALVLTGMGGSPVGFRSRQIRADMVEQADLILLMAGRTANPFSPRRHMR